MEFRIADTFTESLSKLTGDEQKAVKTTAFDLQMNPANPGMQFHKLDRARDPNFWSVRVSRDVRLIVHKTKSSLLLCYVGHHDDAYAWAERRKIERHPKTGAAQLVEVRETIKEITIPKYVEQVERVLEKARLFASVPDDDLLGFGVPEEWLEDVRLATEDTLFDVADHLPSEAAEALLELATGGTPRVATKLTAGEDAFGHPDAQRRFRIMSNVEELERALEAPWEKWAVFLHPTQREIVERDFSGPARVSGSAGTGKTIVALHRAVFLARKHQNARVLLATFSDTLANALRNKLALLIGNEPKLAERLELRSMLAIGQRLYRANFGRPSVVSSVQLNEVIRKASSEVEAHRFSQRFLFAEWASVVDAWQLRSWEEYRDVKRLGRKTRLAEPQRKFLWQIFERVRQELEDRSLITEAEMFARLNDKIKESGSTPFEYAVVDEAQDISVAQLRFLAALGGDRSNSLFFSGDLGQRIFQQPFSWMSLGVEIRGRSQNLKINYRTSHQIRSQADRLLGPEVTDVDGITEDRRGTISVFNGPDPEIRIVAAEESESDAVVAWIQELLSEGVQPHEIALFVRSESELNRAVRTVESADLKHVVLDETVRGRHGAVSIGTMHLAKGLEYRAVAVIACDDEVIPSQDRIEEVSEDSDLEEVYQTERHLLYVACTRARDRLLVTGVEPGSEFLEDLVA